MAAKKKPAAPPDFRALASRTSDVLMGVIVHLQFLMTREGVDLDMPIEGLENLMGDIDEALEKTK